MLTMAPPILQQPKLPSHHLDPLSPPVPSRVASVAILMTGQGISLIGPARLVEQALEEPAPLLIIHWEPDLVDFFYSFLTIVLFDCMVNVLKLQTQIVCQTV